MSIGSKITELRISKGLTRVQLASELEVPMTTLRNYENDDREPGHKFLVKVANYFSVTTDYILENEKSPATEGAEDSEISLDEMMVLLRRLGLIGEGDDITEKDAAFVSGVFDLLEAWFSR